MNFTQVYQENSLDVFRYCMFHLRNKEIAEDAASEAFTRFMQNEKSANLPTTQVKPWLFGIARNVVRENYAHTKAKSHVSLDSDLVPSSNKDPELKAIDAELVSMISQELDKLPELTREIIILKIWEDFSFKEISKVVSKSESNCKLTYYRALEQIKLQLGERKPSKKLYSVSGLIIPAILQLKQLPSLQISPAFQAHLTSAQFNSYQESMQKSTIQELMKRKLFIFAAISTVLIVAIVSIVSLVLISNNASQEPVVQPEAQQPSDELPTEPDLVPMEPEDEVPVDPYAGWTKVDTDIAYSWDIGNPNPVMDHLNLKFYFPSNPEISDPNGGGGYYKDVTNGEYTLHFFLRMETFENPYTNPRLVGNSEQFGNIYEIGTGWDGAWIYTNDYTPAGSTCGGMGAPISGPCGFGTFFNVQHSLEVRCTGSDKAICDKIVLSLTTQDI